VAAAVAEAEVVVEVVDEVLAVAEVAEVAVA
jgi:hypothetical protein